MQDHTKDRRAVKFSPSFIYFLLINGRRVCVASIRPKIWTSTLATTNYATNWIFALSADQGSRHRRPSPLPSAFQKASWWTILVLDGRWPFHRLRSARVVDLIQLARYWLFSFSGGSTLITIFTGSHCVIILNQASPRMSMYVHTCGCLIHLTHWCLLCVY